MATALRYRGYQSLYVDIASRGKESLGLSVQYAVHPSNIGCFILRFIVHGKGIDPKNYTHLTYREPAEFLIEPTAEQPTAEKFKGVRLNKIALPVFKPAVRHHEVDSYALKFAVWSQVTDWVAAQVVAEGFTITVTDLAAEIRGLVVPDTTVHVENILQFPDLTAPEQQAAALKLVKKPEPEPDEDEDVEGDEPKEWLN